MKVFHITRGFGDYLVELLNAQSAFLDVHVALSSNDKSLANHLSPRIHVYHTGAPNVKHVGNVPVMLKTRRLIADVAPDVIHYQGGVVWELGILASFANVPRVATMHDVIKHPMRNAFNSMPQAFLDLAGRIANKVIVHAELLRPVAAVRYKKKLRDVVAIPHGIISRYGESSSRVEVRDDLRVLLFGTLDEWKGIEYLVQAVGILNAKNVRLSVIIAGGCRDPGYYLGLTRNTINIDIRPFRQNDDEVRQLFTWADIVALPYVEASQSGVLQLAFAFGIPAVVTDVGGLAEATDNGKCGLIVPSKDAVALAESIEKLGRDTSLRKRIMDSISDAKHTRLNWTRIAQATARLYETMLRV